MPKMKQQLIERIKVLDRMDGWCTQTKALDLAQLIIDHRPDVVVELGVYGARSLAAMAMACQHIYNGHCTGIDPWTKDAALEGGTNPENDKWWAELDIERIYRVAISNIRTFGLDDFITIERKHDVDALPLFGDGSIGLLNIDSNHGELVSVRTVKDWVPKVKIGGLVAFDDSDWPSTQKAVALLHEGLGTKHVKTYNMTGPPDDAGNPTHAGQWMLFERVS